MLKIVLFIFYVVLIVQCHPTMYKLKDNKLEPDLVPVSSTVIPLPVYKVSYGINASPNHHHHKDEKLVKPDGPITLITVHNQKKLIPTPKQKRYDQKSTVREVDKKQFSN